MKEVITSRILWTIPVLITICFFSFPAYAKYSGGTGEPNDPYQIATAEDLMLLGESPEDNGKHFILTADIDLDPNLPGRKVFDRAVIGPYTYDVGEGWQGMRFTGVFDGNGKKIYNFSYTSTDRNCVGLFGTVDGPNAQIINLGLVNPDIKAGTRASVGSLVGRLKTGRIVGCYVEDGSVCGEFSVGGLVGQTDGTITDGTIINCYSTGNISGNDAIGGLIGGNIGTVDGCYSTCNVTGTMNVGGLVGQNGVMTLSWDMWTPILISGTISNCYSTGTVTGNQGVGGLVGFYWVGIITNCYATGKVWGNKNVGSLVGYGAGELAEACFWDIETSGQRTSDGGIGLTTAEMQTAATFLEAGWDFVGETDNGTEDIWKINEGNDYPRLWWEKYSGGKGDPNDPYRIATAEDLMLLGESPEDYDKHFILIDDIDLDPNLPGRKVFDKAVIAPDVNDTKDRFQGIPFTGVLNGNGHIISHLTIDGGNYLGLFGQLGNEANVINLGLNAVYINGTGFNVGGLVGQNNGKIEECYISGIVSGKNCIGGLVGSNSDMTTLVMHSEYTGGGILTNCYSTGVIRGKSDVGGLVGWNYYGTITDCHSTASMMGTHGVGGLVGWNFEGKISGCSSSGNVQGRSEPWCLGGLVGTNSSSFGKRAEIINCYSCGDVSGETYLGGLVGINSGGWPFGMARIINCYSTGTITGIKFLGGLVGSNSDAASIVNCYATGRVNGATNAGGLVGENKYSPATITSSLWDIETSGRSNMCGIEVPGGSGCDDVNGKTTAEMQTASTFLEAGWDFVDESVNGTEDIWSICEGTNYPRLAWQIPAGDFICPDGITIDDFVFFIEHWRDDNCAPGNDYCQGTDLDFSGTVDEADLEILIENWLAVGSD